MRKVKETNTSNFKKERTKRGVISIRNKKNGKEARVTLQLNIPGVKNPRLQKYGETEAIARRRLAEAIVLESIKLQKSKEYANIQVFSPECQIELNKFDEYIDCLREYQLGANGERKKSTIKNEFLMSTYIEKMILKKKKLSEPPKAKISPKSVSYYVQTANSKVVPYFGEMDVRKITKEQIEEYFDTLDCSKKYLQHIKLVLKQTFDIVVKDNLRNDNPAKDIKIDNSKKPLGIEIEHLEQDRQEVWLDLFEKDKRQWAYLFETLLLTGARPEEGCGLKWSAIDFNKDIVHIRNAYKDIILYDDDLNVIGHKRGDGPLKTPESYRDIPLHPRLKKLLLLIKSTRMKEYLIRKKSWNENGYVFLNENNEPFVSENLTNKMPLFIKKYNLEHLTTYGLRHSFATLCSTLGIPPEVLHVIMGHADFDTTRKYYIHITEERKKNEMIKVYIKQHGEDNLQKLIAENDVYFDKITTLRVQDIKSYEKMAI